jgi:hypothetical protein
MHGDIYRNHVYMSYMFCVVVLLYFIIAADVIVNGIIYFCLSVQ